MLSAYADRALASRRRQELRMRHCPLPSGEEVARDLFLRVHLSGHGLCSRDRGWMAARFSIANVGTHRGHQYAKEPKHS